MGICHNDRHCHANFEVPPGVAGVHHHDPSGSYASSLRNAGTLLDFVGYILQLLRLVNRGSLQVFCECLNFISNLVNNV
jgi:hypothetical protein